jgi:Predicted glycosyltransferases
VDLVEKPGNSGMATNTLISVVIVTWNAERFIKACLDSVFAQDLPLLEVIVVDNGSSDKTVTILKEYAQRICLIRNDRNQGFCAANNQALIKAAGRYVLTLNSDMVLEKNYAGELVRCLERNPRVGMVQGKMLRLDKKTIDCLGLRIGWGVRFHNIGEGKPDSRTVGPEREIFGPCAAAALYRRELLNDIRWRDEFLITGFSFWSRISTWPGAPAIKAGERAMFRKRNVTITGTVRRTIIHFGSTFRFVTVISDH